MLTKNLLDMDLFPNHDFDWIKKMNQGKFNQFREQKLKIFKEGKPKEVMLSNRIHILNIDFLKINEQDQIK